MTNKLQEILNNAEQFQDTYGEPTSIVVTDTTKYLLHLPAEFDKAHIPTGTPLKDISNPFIDEVLKTGKKLRMEIGPERFGFPFLLTCNPILEQNQVVGLLMTTTSTEKMESLKRMSSELAATVEEMSTTTEEVAKVSNIISDKVQVISGDSELISKTVQNVYKVIKSIQYIANQSNILGLNASIEAARAGEYGKGFAVVANEIRKMADQSKDSSSKIIKFLEQVNEAVNENNSAIQDIAAMMEEHSASIEELQSAFNFIATAAVELNKTAN